MSALATVTLTVSFALVKHMVSTWLGDGAAGQVGQDLLDLCRDRLAEWGGSKDERAQLDRLAVQVVADMTPLWETESRTLDAGAKTAVVLAVGNSVVNSRIDAVMLIQHRLDAERLAGSLAEHHVQQSAGFGPDELAVYHRLLVETSQRIVYVANHVAGYGPLVDRHTLLTLDLVLYNLEQLMAGPAVATRDYEQEYLAGLSRQLNRFDTVGISYAEEALYRQSLDLAYIGLRLEQDEPQDRSAERFDGTMPGMPAGKDRLSTIRQPANRSGTIQEMLALSSRLVICGQPGSGKSTLLRWLAVRSSCRQMEQDFVGMGSWDDTVPFYLRLRTVKQGGIPQPQEWPKANGSMLALEAPLNWVHGLLRSGRALVLIDGVDEVSVQHRKSLLQDLQQLVASYPLARYVITSRPAAIKNWPEWNDWIRSQGFLSVSLLEMEQEQVFAFIDQWHAALLKGTLNAEEQARIRQSPAALKQLLRHRLPLRRLARNPLLCTMICALHRDRPNNMPQNRVKLYQDCVEMLLYKRDSERGVVSMGDYPSLTHTHEEVVLREFAHHLLLNGDSEESAEDVDAYFDELLQSIHMPGWSGPVLRDYFVTRTGLLIEPGDGQITFAHRTFQEYLAAKVIVKKNEISMLLGKARDDQWRETILLTVAIPEINEKQSEKLFRGLLKKAETSTKQRSRQELYLLAVACMESPIYLSATLRQEILEHAATVIPPRNDDEVALIAKAGDPVVEMLRINPRCHHTHKSRCVTALAEIGNENALSAIAEYATSAAYGDIRAQRLRQAIGKAIWRFDPAEYCRRVLETITVLDLGDTQVNDAGLAQLVTLTDLKRLFLMNTQVSDTGLAQLATLTGLKRLLLMNTQVSDVGLAHIAGLTNLELLNLSSTRVSDAGLSHLVALPDLQMLYLVNTQVSDAGLPHLAQLPRLQSLSLADTQVSEAGLPNLATFPSLHEIYLNNFQMSEAGLAHLATLSNLEFIYLGEMSITEAGLAHLATLPNLQGLNLYHTQVNDAGLARLTALTELHRIHLCATQVSDTGLGYLAALTGLESIDLSNTQVSDAGLVHLVAHPNLQKLNLSGTQVSDDGLAHLATLTSLQVLYLMNTQVSDDGLAHLAALSNLRELDLSCTQVSDAGLVHLAAIPNLQDLDLSNTQVRNTYGLNHMLGLDIRL